jgi:integrase
MPRTRSRLFQRKDSPFWWAVFTDPGGRVVRQSTGCRDHQAASTWLSARELERARASAGIPVARPLPLIVATAQYLEERERVWSGGWLDTVTAFVRNEVVPAFGEDRSVHSIDRAEVARFRAMQIGRPSKRGKTGKPIGSATVNRLMAAMAAFGEWCVERGLHTENPWAKHEALAEEERPAPEADTHQLDALLAALPERWRGPFTFAVDTGLRRSELQRLEWSRVNLKAGTATVTNTKNRKKARTVALTQRARAVLESLPHRTGPVFGGLGDPRKALARAAKVAGLGHVWTHAFRHYWATRMSATGASLSALMKGGGWTTPRMVTRYATAHLSELRAATERLEAAEEATRGARGESVPQKDETPQPKS